jgi:acid phosphatase
VACYSRNSGEYAVKHNPFVYYENIRGNQSRCEAHVVPYTSFPADLKSASTLPDYSFISPNMCNDMHNCTIQAGDSWLAREVPRILASPAFTRQNSLLVVVWDEGHKSDNRVLAIFAGAAAKKGYVSRAKYDHYSLLRTIESVWHLPPLTRNDANAPVMTDMLSH